jgi:hypothetical protein
MTRNAPSPVYVLFMLAFVYAGCVDRPLASASPDFRVRWTEGTLPERITKIDLLFMIDNSPSMADKERILAQAIPELVHRLADPMSMNPITDMHVGVISSSLGGHGAKVCGVSDSHSTRARTTGPICSRAERRESAVSVRDAGAPLNSCDGRTP